MQGPKSESNSQPAKKPFSAPEFKIKIKSSFKNVQKKKEIKTKSTKAPTDKSASQKAWYEAMSEDGYKYYWNTETSGIFCYFVLFIYSIITILLPVKSQILKLVYKHGYNFFAMFCMYSVGPC